MQLAPTRIRVPDFAAFVEEPKESVPISPPFVFVEILSPDDRHGELGDKLADYHAWGVPHVWLADPSRSQDFVYTDAGLSAVESLRLPEFSFVITPIDLFG